jgi:hypothetical protein
VAASRATTALLLVGVGGGKGRKCKSTSSKVRLVLDVPQSCNPIDGNMEHRDGRGDSQKISRAAPVVSATLRPPKRHGEDGATQRIFPKRPRPSPDAEINSPIPRTKSETLLGGDHDFVPAYTPSPQAALQEMDWTPSSGPIVGIGNVDRDSMEESDPRICYGAVRKQSLLIPSWRAAVC